MDGLFPEDLRSARIVVVSPHSDDGVLSVGAAMSAWARGGARVVLLTVLGCDPESSAPSGGWDRRAGFASEGEAAVARREEDRLACAELGVEPVWLAFGSVDYERHGDAGEVREAVAAVVDDAEAALVPGFPLTHPDHEWLVRVLSDGQLGARRLGLYAEQPYARRSGATPHVPAWAAERLGGTASFSPARSGPRDRLAKWRAIRRYRSQLPLLAMRGLRGGAHVYAAVPEPIAWDVA